ncbi:MAG TPA: acylneuraminate cytidylyltransferase family protein [Thermoanaerobaculia bacterium]|nr:acylneuraminate cytidylyltransferase family protein [Thermoanaerobaculia bacterium]
MILGVIPARGGSKGIPRKNLRMLCGKPLIAWSIEAGLNSKRIDRLVVSTEDAEIAKVAKEWGAEVVPRPPELATDDAATLDVLQHVVSRIPAETVVLLQPTSPVRDADLVDRCIDQFEKKHADSLATGFICKYTEYGKNELRRQDITGFFYDDGNVYVMRGDLLAKGDRYGQAIERVLLDREQNIDIDDEFDFFVAEQVLKRRNGRG